MTFAPANAPRMYIEPLSPDNLHATAEAQAFLQRLSNGPLHSGEIPAELSPSEHVSVVRDRRDYGAIASLAWVAVADSTLTVRAWDTCHPAYRGHGLGGTALATAVEAATRDQPQPSIVDINVPTDLAFLYELRWALDPVGDTAHNEGSIHLRGHSQAFFQWLNSRPRTIQPDESSIVIVEKA